MDGARHRLTKAKDRVTVQPQNTPLSLSRTLAGMKHRLTKANDRATVQPQNTMLSLSRTLADTSISSKRQGFMSRETRQFQPSLMIIPGNRAWRIRNGSQLKFLQKAVSVGKSWPQRTPYQPFSTSFKYKWKKKEKIWKSNRIKRYMRKVFKKKKTNQDKLEKKLLNLLKRNRDAWGRISK